MPDADFAARVRTALGDPAAVLIPVAGSVENVNARVDLTDGRVLFAKAGPPASLAAEAWAMGRANRAGVPVAEIAYAAPGLLITRGLPGAPSRDRSVWTAAGAAVARLHTVSGVGFGGADDHGRGPWPRWSGYLASRVAGAAALVPAGVLTADVLAQATAVIGDVGADYAGPGALLHCDLKPAHLLAERDRLTGILDFGDPTLGDPAYDLARVSMARLDEGGAELVDAFFAGYGSRPDPERLRRYRLVLNLGILTHEWRAGGDWFDAYRDRIAADL